MRRLPATAVYYGLEFLLRVPTWVVMAVYLGLLIAPALGLYARAIAHQGREPELEELPPADVLIS